MGKYFNPPETLPAVGRRLNGSFSIEGLQNQLKPKEFLIGSYFNGSYTTTPWIENAKMFNEFESKSIDTSYYAVDEATFAKYVH